MYKIIISILLISLLFQNNNSSLKEIYKKLNIHQDFDNDTIIEEAEVLVSIGHNILDKEIFLSQKCAEAWMRMKKHAAQDSVQLDILSGFRSYQKQYQIIQNKLNRGMNLDSILKENKLPGFSQHHSGNAIDIVSNSYKLSVEFEKSTAYKWLLDNANQYGFHLPYTKNNQEGIIFEPWHWFYVE